MKKFLDKSLVITTLLAISTCWSYAQENFIPGYIISPGGDTTKGMINDRNWSGNPEKISFRYSDGKEKEFGPYDIAGFGMSVDHYVSATVQTENSPYQTEKLNFIPELVLDTNTVFLYRMVQGPKELLHYKDKDGKDHFYFSTDTSYTLLIHKLFLKELDKKDVSGYQSASQTRIIENKTYLGQLSLYFQDCPAIRKAIGLAGYDQTGLLKIFARYYKECHGQAVQAVQRSTKIDFGLVAGLTLNSLSFENNNTFDFAKTKYGYQSNLAAGFLFDLRFRGNMQKWSLYNEILFAPYRVKGEYNNYINPERYTIITTDIGETYVKMNNMIRFNFPLGKVSVFINGGMSNGISIAHKNYIKREVKYYSTEYTEEGKAIESTDSYEMGLIYGLGTSYKKWAIEMRREHGDGMSSLAALKSKTTKYLFLVSYRF